MKRLVKICGLRDPENIREVFGLKPDLAGLIFHPKSPRYVSDPSNLVFLNELKERPLIAGVFVNPGREMILDVAKILRLDIIQLHGTESPKMCEYLRGMGYSVIKAFGIGEDFDFSQTIPYEGMADYFLFDSRSREFGGSGHPFDWSRLVEYRGTTPWFLSGGLSPETRTIPSDPLMAGVDLNSRFESAPGVKDTGLLQQFLKHYRDE
jgi:phosphoribosylanthranilate isomerase